MLKQGPIAFAVVWITEVREIWISWFRRPTISDMPQWYCQGVYKFFTLPKLRLNHLINRSCTMVRARAGDYELTGVGVMQPRRRRLDGELYM